MDQIIHKFIDCPHLSEREYILLLQQADDNDAKETLRKEALCLCRMHYGNAVYIRGLIEFTNYCKIIVTIAVYAEITTM